MTTKKPKLLLATPYYASKVGGLENYAHHIARQLIKRGWEVCAVTTNHEGNTYAEDVVDGVRVYRLPASFKLSNTSVGFSWPKDIRAIIATEHPDVINVHTPVPGIADAASRAAGSVPVVVTYHAATLYKHRDFIFNTIIFAYRFIERFMLNKARGIIAVSPYHKDYLSKRVKRKMYIIENAIPASELQAETTAKKANRLFFINNLSKAHAWKGLDLILEAIAIYARQGNDIELDVVGDGDYADHYKRRAEELHIAHLVKFHGEQRGAGKYTPLRQATALVSYPTTANDAFPTIVLEAWANRTPVILANIGALPHIVHDGTDGLLAKAHDPAALAAVFAKLLPDTKLQAELIEAGYRRAEHLTWDHQGQKTDEYLRGLLR